MLMTPSKHRSQSIRRPLELTPRARSHSIEMAPTTCPPRDDRPAGSARRPVPIAHRQPPLRPSSDEEAGGIIFLLKYNLVKLK
jgi:hypothetical protein